MEEGRRKPVMIGVVVACLVLAVFIWIKFGSGGGGAGNIKSIPKDARTRLLCRACSASWEMASRDYHKYIRDHITGAQTPPLPCEECGEENSYKGVKCGKCDKIFLYGTMANTFADQCPDCGYSQVEVNRKEAAERRRAQK